MNQISAADNVTIDMETGRWRLIANGGGVPFVVVEAMPELPLRYIDSFATSRRLPSTGALPINYIKQIVLGWSNKDEAWHLGLTLGNELAGARGSRWCELARWPDPDTTLFRDIAETAGRELAKTLVRPFHVIQPRPIVAPPPAPPLPNPPFRFGDWTLVADETSSHSQLLLKRARSWALGKWLRVVWYGFWAGVFALLSVKTLTSGLALPNVGTMLPNPDVLPYLGLISAVILVGLIFHNLWQWLRLPDRIVIDPQRRVLTGLRSKRERWEIGANEVESVFVTQVVHKDVNKNTVFYGEINLYRGDGDFFTVARLPQPEDVEALYYPDAPIGEGVTELTTYYASTPLQFTGLHIAESLGGLPAYYDQRIK